MQYKLLFAILLALFVVTFGWYFRSDAPQPTGQDVAPLAAQNVSDEVVAEEVPYFEDAKGYFVRPAGAGVHPGVVMIHENRGLRPEIKAAAEDLAREGYMVLAVDLYGVVMETQEEARAFSQTYDAAKGLDNLHAATEYLRQSGANKVASLGWCFGGAQSLALATSGEKLDGTIIYYGRLQAEKDDLDNIDWPVLGIFGDQDQAISTTSVANFEQTLQELEVPVEIHMYEGVGHAFANPSNQNHAPEETADAWQKTLTFLDRTLR